MEFMQEFDQEAFRTFKDKGFFAVVKKSECGNAQLMDCVLKPEKYLEKSRIIKDSRSTKAGICRLDSGRDIFIKRYNSKGLKYTLKYLFRQAKAFRAFNSSWYCENMQIPASKAIAASAERRTLMLGRSYLISDAIDGLVPTLDFCKDLFASEKLQNFFFESVSCLFSKMHDSGFVHNDAKLSNIFVRKTEDSYLFGVWDLDASVVEGGKISESGRIDEIARFLSSYREIAGRFGIKVDIAVIAEIFIPLYCSRSGVNLDRGRIIKRTASHK